MIMRVDESRQQKISAEIDLVRTRFVVIFMRARKNMCDPACGNLQIKDIYEMLGGLDLGSSYFGQFQALSLIHI